MAEGLLVALGGHALLPRGVPASVPAQARALEAVCAELAGLAVAAGPLVLTHGNGPQAGQAWERVEAAHGRAYPLPLHLCVAQTQAEIGFLLATALERALAARGRPRPVTCVLTRVAVDPADPAFARPTKPLGPRGAGPDTRPRVPSPAPRRVLEAPAVAALLAAGHVVVAAGGGGVPVAPDGPGGWRGVEAVIDKDATSTLLALALGLPRLLQLTDVDHVERGWGTPAAARLPRLTAARARALLAEGAFEQGSMAPKLEAAAAFVEGGGRCVDVTAPGRVEAALAGHAGTRVEEGP